MSTQAIFIVKGHENAKEDDTHYVFRHWDGYPSAIMRDLQDVLKFAWPLPRWEPDDFAAAIIRAWKHEGGGSIRTAKDEHAWVNFLYTIYLKDERLWVRIEKVQITKVRKTPLVWEGFFDEYQSEKLV